MTDHQIGLIGLIVAAVAMFGTWLSVPRFQPQWRKNRKIQITSPRALEVLQEARHLSPGLCYRVAGTLNRLPKDHRIWLLVENPITKQIWPQGFTDVSYRSDIGAWEGFVRTQGSGPITIVAVVAPPTSQRMFHYYQRNGTKTGWDPLDGLPAECRNIATVQAQVP